MPVLTRSQTRLVTERRPEISYFVALLDQNARINDAMNCCSEDDTNELLEMLQINQNKQIQFNNEHPSLVRFILCNLFNCEKYYNKLFQ